MRPPQYEDRFFFRPSRIKEALPYFEKQSLPFQYVDTINLITGFSIRTLEFGHSRRKHTKKFSQNKITTAYIDSPVEYLEIFGVYCTG